MLKPPFKHPTRDPDYTLEASEPVPQKKLLTQPFHQLEACLTGLCEMTSALSDPPACLLLQPSSKSDAATFLYHHGFFFYRQVAPSFLSRGQRSSTFLHHGHTRRHDAFCVPLQQLVTIDRSRRPLHDRQQALHTRGRAVTARKATIAEYARHHPPGAPHARPKADDLEGVRPVVSAAAAVLVSAAAAVGFVDEVEDVASWLFLEDRDKLALMAHGDIEGG